MATFTVEYVFDPEKYDERAAAREAHRTFVEQLTREGHVLTSGSRGNAGTFLVIDAKDEAAARELIHGDPFREVVTAIEIDELVPED